MGRPGTLNNAALYFATRNRNVFSDLFGHRRRPKSWRYSQSLVSQKHPEPRSRRKSRSTERSRGRSISVALTTARSRELQKRFVADEVWPDPTQARIQSTDAKSTFPEAMLQLILQR